LETLGKAVSRPEVVVQQDIPGRELGAFGNGPGFSLQVIHQLAFLEVDLEDAENGKYGRGNYEYRQNE
jgi:hypothetical protein